ncbi:formylglycine-generating enzyme family protein [Alteromonas oceanisediminis]|uniref:formylglycine-generating enzyme family protein n=1 Tax=Alteromonas oceanisediminis TaxID=2836180 RepID=UPI001BDA61B1|nr:formylglycine-generating enzyme family protein [Alteromonas oceanisediminis]MBT0584917.1 formylglycine-generating enzyme family protein [Alteromonas oceanisediminis]
MRKSVIIPISAALIVGLAVVVARTTVFDGQYSSDVLGCDPASGMVLIDAGRFVMGAGAEYPEETPAKTVSVNSFYISRHEVTNAEFAEFVEATGYKTVAERKPDPHDYPDMPAHLLQPGSAVFVKLSEAVGAGTFANWWHFTPGAYWKAPTGPGSSIEGKAHYPVVHIAFEDATRYAQWKGHRLPTEAEFEYVSRGGLNGAKYASGNSLTYQGEHIANTWQGLFPFNDTAEDGFEGLAPVGCYPQNLYGVYDMIGNVWEWTQSTYYPRHYSPHEIPEGMPETGFDQNQPNVPVGVIKGGSFLCADDFCMRYRPAARHAQDTHMGTSHIGFRTVADVSPERFSE